MSDFNVEERARQSAGESAAPIHEAVLAALKERGVRARCLLDVGCGTGSLRERVRGVCDRYLGADAIRHEGLPADADFVLANLDTGKVALPDGACDVVACVETIEHVENPRALMRELVRLTAPNGCLVVTTPKSTQLAFQAQLVLQERVRAFSGAPRFVSRAHLRALGSGLGAHVPRERPAGHRGSLHGSGPHSVHAA